VEGHLQGRDELVSHGVLHGADDVIVPGEEGRRKDKGIYNLY
jgi:hypothetical protein